jgi:hypothetical protein
MRAIEIPEIKSAQAFMNMFRTDLAGDVSVVTALDFVDISNHHFMRHDLLTASVYTKVVVANLSAAFCDSSVTWMLEEMADKLASRGCELRAVITNPMTLRFMRAFKVDATVPIFPTVLQALHAPQDDWMPESHSQAA